MMPVIALAMIYPPFIVPFLSEGPRPQDFGCFDAVTSKTSNNSDWCFVEGVFLHWFSISASWFGLITSVRLLLIAARMTFQSQLPNKLTALAPWLVHLIGWIVLPFSLVLPGILIGYESANGYTICMLDLILGSDHIHQILLYVVPVTAMIGLWLLLSIGATVELWWSAKRSVRLLLRQWRLICFLYAYAVQLIQFPVYIIIGVVQRTTSNNDFLVNWATCVAATADDPVTQQLICRDASQMPVLLSSSYEYFALSMLFSIPIVIPLIACYTNAAFYQFWWTFLKTQRFLIPESYTHPSMTRTGISLPATPEQQSNLDREE